MTRLGFAWTVMALCLVAVGGQAHAQTEALVITSPASGTKVRPGQSVTVTVSVSGGVTFKMMMLGGEDPIDLGELLTTPPYSFTITVPSNIGLRPHRVFATGETSAGADVNSRAILIDVERDDTPTNLDVGGSVREMKVGDTIQMLVDAEFADGNRHNIKESTEISYQSSATQIATVDATGGITAKGPGVAIITVTYRGLKSQVKVIVAPR